MDPLEGQAPAAAAVEPQPAAVVPTVQDGLETYDPQTHIKVPKSDLGDYDGRWGGVMGDAHKYQEAQQAGLLEPGIKEFAELARQNNMTPQQALDYVTGADQTPLQTPAVQPGYGQPAAQPALTPDDQPLTVGGFNRIREEDRAASDAAAATAANKQQLQVEFDTVAGTLKGYGFNFSEDGLPADSTATIARQMYNGALNDVLTKDIPEWYDQDQRQQTLSGLSTQAASMAQLNRASTLFQERYKEFRQSAVVDFVKGQEGVPAETLGGGAGGPVSKKPENMTEAEIEQAVMGAVDRRMGVQPGG